MTGRRSAELHLKAGALAREGFTLEIQPEGAGWVGARLPLVTAT